MGKNNLSSAMAVQLTKVYDQVVVLEGELHSVRLNKSSLGKEAQSIAARLDELKRSPGIIDVNRGHYDLTRKADHADVIALESESARVNAEFASVTGREKQLVTDIASLTDEMAGIGVITIDDLAHWQKEVDIITERIQHINQAMGHQQQLLSKAQSTSGQISSLSAEREKLLAEISLGEADQGELEKLDRKIEKHEKEHDAKERGIIKPAKQTLAGLQEKLTASENTLAIMQQQGKSLLFAYLVGTAEQRGKEYTTLANQLSICFAGLVSCGRMIEKSKNKDILGRTWDEMLIPALNLNACVGGRDGGYLFKAVSDFAESKYSVCQEVDEGELLKVAPGLDFAIR